MRKGEVGALSQDWIFTLHMIPGVKDEQLFTISL